MRGAQPGKGVFLLPSGSGRPLSRTGTGRKCGAGPACRCGSRVVNGNTPASFFLRFFSSCNIRDPMVVYRTERREPMRSESKPLRKENAHVPAIARYPPHHRRLTQNSSQSAAASPINPRGRHAKESRTLNLPVYVTIGGRSHTQGQFWQPSARFENGSGKKRNVYPHSVITNKHRLSV